MDVVIHNAKDVGGCISAIPSKSMAHRYFICSALSNDTTTIKCSSSSNDIKATINCLTSMGAVIDKITDDTYKIKPIDKSKLDSNYSPELFCGESGSTLRFLLPVVASFGGRATINMEGRLSKRPLSPLYEEMLKHGCTLSKEYTNPFITQGKMTSGEFVIDGGVSSQFVSGLLFALPLLDGDSKLKLVGKVESLPYILMTLQSLKIFDIKIDTNIWDKKGEGRDIYFNIKGNQIYKSPKELDVEGDWSNIAFWLCAGAIGNNDIKCGNVKFNSLQGDKKVCDILEQFGANITYNKGDSIKNDSLLVKRERLNAITIDASDIPDLIPILSVVAALANGTTTVINASRLRIKESDRIKAITTTLKNLCANVKELDDGLIIEGKPSLKGGVVDSFNDHRIVMMSAIASICCEDEVIIKNAQAVNKSYPTFFDDFKKLNADITINE